MKHNKKGQLGMDTVKTVMIAFLILAVIAFTLMVLLLELRDVSEDIIDLTTVTVSNESYTGTNVSGTKLSVYDRRLCSVTASYVDNGSAGTIPTSNYSIAGCLITLVGESGFQGHALNVTYTYTYAYGGAADIKGNVTAGTTDFFSNTSTIFAILVVVVIILAIAIIIAVVTRFGGGRGEVGGGRGRSRGREAGTVMGI